jgi:hypothetical protein
VPDGYADELARARTALARLVKRAASLPLRAWRDPALRADARALAQRLAEVAQGVEGRLAPSAPAPRKLPELPEHALADAIAVTGADALDALAAVPADEPVWLGVARRSAADALEQVSELLGRGMPNGRQGGPER